MLEKRGFCFYEHTDKCGRKGIQAKWFDRESGVTYYLKPGRTEDRRAVADGEMWFCEIGETTFSQLDEEGCRTVSEVVRVLPTQYLGIKRGEWLILSFSPDCRGHWETSRCLRQLGSGNQLVEIQFVLDRQSDATPGHGPCRCRVTKLVHSVVPGRDRRLAAEAVVAVEIVSPTMATKGGGRDRRLVTVA